VLKPARTPRRGVSLSLFGVIGGCLVGLAGCDSPAPPVADLPPQVIIETVELKPLALTRELTGRVRAPRVAQVRARASGIVVRQVFKEGREVKRGDVLFLIDPAPLQVERDSAAANLRKARVSLDQSRVQLRRYEQLAKISAISQQEFDVANFAEQQLAAEVDSAQAALSRAQLNLGYATVTAPISGRAGRALVTEGTLVGQDEATLMVNIQQLDPVYVDLTQTTREFAQLRRALRGGSLQRVGDEQAAARLVEEDGALYPLPGKLLFSDLNVEESTGQIVLRSEFPNPDGDLLPGSFVRVRLAQGVDERAMTIPQRAVTLDAAGQGRVRLVADDGTVSSRSIRTDGIDQDRWIVSDGLKAGERVITDGLQHVRDGQRVRVMDDARVATLPPPH
jgi:membrane fusion protein, multidrug efflux system